MADVKGINQGVKSTLLILPMLGRKVEEYKGFKDCRVEDDKIFVYTSYITYDENLNSDKNFINAEIDETSQGVYYTFEVPKKWKTDFNKIVKGNIKGVSIKYVNYLKKFYHNNPMIDIIFKKETKGV